MERYDVVVIGAGPAGLFCALQAAPPGHDILLLEKTVLPVQSSCSLDRDNVILHMVVTFVIFYLIMVIIKSR